MSRPTCSHWRPDECGGTPDCPPRCPRYVAPDGSFLTVYEAADYPGDEVGPTPSGEERTTEDSDVELVAVGEAGTPLGTAWLDDAEATIRTTAAADGTVAVELGRQFVARAVAADRTGELLIDGPAAALDRLATELDAERAVGRAVVDLDSRAARRTATTPDAAADLGDVADLRPLFDPETVAVVGATDREGTISRVVCENLFEGFDGAVIPVTDRRESVLGVETVPDLAAVDESVDLAVVVLPADAAVEAVRAAGRAGVEAVAVLAAGFGETDEAGRRREAELRAMVDEYDLSLVGPNSLGVVSTRAELNASFAGDLPDAGDVSLASHSGAFVTATLDWAEDADLGIRDVVSLGNAVGLDEATLLRAWGADPETDVVLAYLEDVADGRAFVDAAREVTPTTPVVALKSGRSEAGAAAAASHTGALTGDDEGFDAAFDAAGVVRVDSTEELYDAGLAFDRLPLPRGDRVAVVTNAGGPGVLATDAVQAAGLDLASLSADTVETLRERLPESASAANPVDVLGDASVGRFVAALDAVLADPGVDAAVVVSTPHPLVSAADLVRGVGGVAERHGVPVATCLAGGAPDDDVRSALSDAGIPNYPEPARAAAALARLREYERGRRRPREAPERPSMDREYVRYALEDAASAGRETLGVDALDLLDAIGIPTPAGGLASDPATAAEIAVDIGDEVVLKAATPDLAHKSDVGGVEVGVDPEEVPAAVRDLRASVRETAPDATVGEVLVQERVADGVECVVGFTRHPRFGPVVTFGLGGVLVEHLDDVAHGLAPLSAAAARRLITSIDGASVLTGARGADPVDLDALAEAVARLSWFAADEDAVAAAEINPLVAAPDGVTALDFHCELDGAGDATAADDDHRAPSETE